MLEAEIATKGDFLLGQILGPLGYSSFGQIYHIRSFIRSFDSALTLHSRCLIDKKKKSVPLLITLAGISLASKNQTGDWTLTFIHF